jgi:hypothetical protein
MVRKHKNMATDIHLASSVLEITFAIQAQHILHEMVVGDIFVPLGGAIREAVAHVSDIVHDASFLGFGTQVRMVQIREGEKENSPPLFVDLFLRSTLPLPPQPLQLTMPLTDLPTLHIPIRPNIVLGVPRNSMSSPEYFVL